MIHFSLLSYDTLQTNDAIHFNGPDGFLLTVTTIHPPFIPGLPAHLNCSSYCSPESSVTWHLYRGDSSIQLYPPQSLSNAQTPENYILSEDGDLVILTFMSSLQGTLACKSNDVTLAEHTIEATGKYY